MTIPNDADAAALAALGWDETFAAAFRALADDDALPARVLARHRAEYLIDGGGGARAAVAAGRLHRESEAARDPSLLPAVGDWVAVAGAEGAGGRAVMRAVLPRRSAFVRKAAGSEVAAQVVAANVDVALLAAPLPDGVNPRRLERFAAMAWEGGAVPVILLTKRDLADDASLAAATADALGAAPGADLVAVSAETGEGLDALAAHLAPGRTAVLLGASGVGKSTLVNRLAGTELLRTAALRADGKGRHTTTHRELVRLASGALLIDTPGVRELALWGSGAGVEAAFDDVATLAVGCRFADCAHDSEPGCAVRDAVARGALDAARLEAWRALARELAWLARRQDDRAMAAERARVKSIMRGARVHAKRKYD
ncbi:MAG: ribosome small subunit-dependent GTPase A [Gemmatimonadaceae bacterium]